MSCLRLFNLRLCGWLLLWPLIVPVSVRAVTPESPQVRGMVERAKQYLADRPHPRVGGKALMGLVFLKDGQADHPRVQEAVAACAELGDRSVAELAAEVELYSICLAAIFLCEYDAVAHRKQIDNILQCYSRRQRDHGGFGYSTSPSGDTSMTQYVVLSYWTAHQKKIPLDWEAIQKVCGWLVRTQDPSGAWGYQGVDPGPRAPRVAQSEVRLSLAAGGLGSAYVCADLLGAAEQLEAVSDAEAQLPAAFLPVEEDQETDRSGGRLRQEEIVALKRAIDDGTEFFRQNFQIPSGQYDHYYLYGLERYKSFRDQLDKRPDPNPQWYDLGVAWLAETQNADGGWDGSDPQGPSDTAFAALFLIRSTQKSIKASLGQGLLTGGRGLPKDTANIRVRQGQVVAEPLTNSPDEILSILEEPDHPDFAVLVDNPESVLLSSDPARRGGEAQRLRRIVRTGSPAARRLAVQALSRHRDFDNVPVLLYALEDQDPAVSRAARDALRFVSRKFDGLGLPDHPTPAEKQAAIAAWKQWFRSVRPGAKLIEAH